MYAKGHRRTKRGLPPDNTLQRRPVPMCVAGWDGCCDMFRVLQMASSEWSAPGGGRGYDAALAALTTARV
jgi:hypothetical protein